MSDAQVEAMMPLTKWFCTELYPTDAEEEIGRVGNFCVYEAADADAAMREAKVEGLEEQNDCLETAWSILANVSGSDWELQTVEWQQAVRTWRDQYFDLLRRHADALRKDQP